MTSDGGRRELRGPEGVKRDQPPSKTKNMDFTLCLFALNVHLRSTGELTLHEEVEVGPGELLVDGL